MSRPDQCPMCGSLNHIALNADGSRYFRGPGAGLWDRFRCVECDKEWKFTFIEMPHD